MSGAAEKIPEIGDLAVIGDRRTAALVARDGSVLWYCPGRFDRPSLFAGLLDASAGDWRLNLPEAVFAGRNYREASGILDTRLRTPDGQTWTITDWLATGAQDAKGLLCRSFSPPPHDAHILVRPRPDYARLTAHLRDADGGVVINGSQALYASHPMSLDSDEVSFTLPKGDRGWAVLADAPRTAPTKADLDRWLGATLDHWRGLAAHGSYEGPYEGEVAASLRAIRLLTHEETGGIIAAATASLPEVVGGSRNWDYRYVWLRDAGMIVSALTRLGADPAEGGRYLDFICSSRGSSTDYPVAVFTTLDATAAPREEILDLEGYLGSRPVRIGNDAGEQMQLDAFGNVLLAAKLMYQRTHERPHWDTVQQIAEFLVEHWREPDHGLWEETAKRQYTSSKVIVACALDSVADFSSDEAQVERWRAAVCSIRAFVSANCLTSEGAYADAAGSEAVDVSAALFPVWAYTAADTPEMRATMAVLERDWSHDKLLYWRRLECADSRREGAFLAGTFWVAQYWVMRGDLGKARQIFDAGLACANDLGLFAEEADPISGRMIGNFPQVFVHAAFIGAVIDLKAALDNSSQSTSKE